MKNCSGVHCLVENSLIWWPESYRADCCDWPVVHLIQCHLVQHRHRINAINRCTSSSVMLGLRHNPELIRKRNKYFFYASSSAVALAFMPWPFYVKAAITQRCLVTGNTCHVIIRTADSSQAFRADDVDLACS